MSHLGKLKLVTCHGCLLMGSFFMLEVFRLKLWSLERNQESAKRGYPLALCKNDSFARVGSVSTHGT